MPAFKLNWNVERNLDGSFLRKTLDGDAWHLAYIDVEWTYTDGAFPADTKDIPTTHPPNIQYLRVVDKIRTMIKDQISVRNDTPDSTIAMILDEKRLSLAKSLKIEP